MEIKPQFRPDFFERVVEASHDEIYVCDDSGATIYCNKTFEQNYGLSRQEVLGKTAMYLQENGFSDITPIPQVLSTKKPITMEQKTKTGRTLIITANPVIDEAGQIEFIVENCRDITDLERIKVKLESAEKESLRYKHEMEILNRTQQVSGEDLLLDGPRIKPIIEIAEKVAATDASILILGESGTGKTCLARHIHANSKRRKGPFLTINCSTISGPLLESELFGYSSGAFTGAQAKGKTGLVELADGGTLFLDEIGEVPLSIQAKFLELLQEKTFTPVGGLKQKKVDLRIVSATNRNLLEQVKTKTFREDLYYRLNVIELSLPPLRERTADIPKMIEHFFIKYGKEFNMKKQLAPKTMDLLCSYAWPGNIRELQNVIQNLIITTPDDIISPDNMPAFLSPSHTPFYPNLNLPLAATPSNDMSLDLNLELLENRIIKESYAKNHSSYKVAEDLGISQSRASRLIRKHCGPNLILE